MTTTQQNNSDRDTLTPSQVGVLECCRKFNASILAFRPGLVGGAGFYQIDGSSGLLVKGRADQGQPEWVCEESILQELCHTGMLVQVSDVSLLRPLWRTGWDGTRMKWYALTPRGAETVGVQGLLGVSKTVADRDPNDAATVVKAEVDQRRKRLSQWRQAEDSLILAVQRAGVMSWVSPTGGPEDGPDPMNAVEKALGDFVRARYKALRGEMAVREARLAYAKLAPWQPQSA